MSWFKQFKKGLSPNETDHSQLMNLNYDKSGHIGFQRQVSVWATGVKYTVNDLVTNNEVLYRCVTAHTSTALSADVANWECLTANGSGVGPGVVQRFSQLNVTVPKTVSLPVSMGLVQARIFVSGSEETQIACDFDNTDASSFTTEGQSGEISPYYIWDGTMRLKSVFQTVFPVHRTMESGMYSESDWINHSKLKTVEKVEVI